MNFKQKNSILFFGFILLVWVAYQFSFSKTIKARQSYNELKQQNELFLSASQNIHNLKQQDTYYNSLLDKYQISTESSFQNNLLNT
jgi:CHASE3 domain sensor protein